MGFNKYELLTLTLAFILCSMPLEDKPDYELTLTFIVLTV